MKTNNYYSDTTWAHWIILCVRERVRFLIWITVVCVCVCVRIFFQFVCYAHWHSWAWKEKTAFDACVFYLLLSLLNAIINNESRWNSIECVFKSKKNERTLEHVFFLVSLLHEFVLRVEIYVNAVKVIDAISLQSSQHDSMRLLSFIYLSDTNWSTQLDF